MSLFEISEMREPIYSAIVRWSSQSASERLGVLECVPVVIKEKARREVNVRGG